MKNNLFLINIIIQYFDFLTLFYLNSVVLFDKIL